MQDKPHAEKLSVLNSNEHSFHMKGGHIPHIFRAKAASPSNTFTLIC